MLHLVGNILSQIGMFFSQLFDTNGFPARWYCGAAWREDPSIGWLHIVSDVAIFCAYLTIPLILTYFLLRRRDLPFPTLIGLFALFIVSCGIGHGIEAIIFWEPVYRLSGLVKAVTAIVSWVTVIAIIPIIPRVLGLPDLERLNDKLEAEIAERTRAEVLFRSVFSAVPNGLVVVDREGKITLANQRMLSMFGYRAEELVGQPIEVLVPEELRDKHVGLRQAFCNAPVGRMMGERRYLEGVKKSGNRFPIEVGLNPSEISGELCIIASVVDVTERRDAENKFLRYTRQLEKSNRDLDEFAYVASHDLRSPLQGVKNLANWIRDDNADSLSDDSQRHLKLMLERIARMERLLDDLLRYSRIGRVDQTLSEVDVSQLLATIIDSLPRPDGISITVESEMPVLVTPIAPLDLALRNLVQNAIKHHDRMQGKIVISVSDEGNFFHFSVRDDGPGILPEFHERVFKMFETLQPRDDVEGSGMGLSIVKKAVEHMGGKIWVDSQLGQGATFTFSWPKQVPVESPV